MTDGLEALRKAIEGVGAAGGDTARLEAAEAAIREGYVRKRPDHFRRVGYLRSLATAPGSIIDVGVSGGTPNLYRAFPDLEFLLVDPQRGAEEKLKSRPARYRFVEKGLGAAPGRLTLTESASQSSFVSRAAGLENEFAPVAQYDVDVITFRDLVETYRPAPPLRRQDRHRGLRARGGQGHGRRVRGHRLPHLRDHGAPGL
jgi:hypothetical protein